MNDVIQIRGEKIFHLNIKPNEAQELILNQNLDLRYGLKISSENEAKPINTEYSTDLNKLNKTDINNLETYKIDYKHGQDGIGGYFFSYSDWNQARMEARNNRGEIRGRYKYKLNDDKEYLVNYWADDLGFHSENNLPKIDLVPVTEEPAVKAAREEHLKKWKEAAELAKKVYDPMSDYYNRFANQYDEQQALLEQEKEIFGDNEFDLRSIINKKQNKKLKLKSISFLDKRLDNVKGFLNEQSYSVPIRKLKLKN